MAAERQRYREVGRGARYGSKELGVFEAGMKCRKEAGERQTST